MVRVGSLYDRTLLKETAKEKQNRDDACTAVGCNYAQSGRTAAALRQSCGTAV